MIDAKVSLTNWFDTKVYVTTLLIIKIGMYVIGNFKNFISDKSSLNVYFDETKYDMKPLYMSLHIGQAFN